MLAFDLFPRLWSVWIILCHLQSDSLFASLLFVLVWYSSFFICWFGGGSWEIFFARSLFCLNSSLSLAVWLFVCMFVLVWYSFFFCWFGGNLWEFFFARSLVCLNSSLSLAVWLFVCMVVVCCSFARFSLVVHALFWFLFVVTALMLALIVLCALVFTFLIAVRLLFILRHLSVKGYVTHATRFGAPSVTWYLFAVQQSFICMEQKLFLSLKIDFSEGVSSEGSVLLEISWNEFVFTSPNSVYTVEVKTSRLLLKTSPQLLLLHLEALRFLIQKWRRKVPFWRTTKTPKVITVFTCCLNLFSPPEKTCRFLFVGFNCNHLFLLHNNFLYC